MPPPPRNSPQSSSNVELASPESIINPEAPLALRLSGQLMLGVVRIYGRKVNYLFQDCSEALVKVKQAFHANTADLPEGGETAPAGVITLPENFDDLELFFEPHAAAGLGHDVGGTWAGTGASNITLEDPEYFDEFEEQYAYDDRIHVDMEDGEYMEDELDNQFHPTPGGDGSDYRTPMSGMGPTDGGEPHDRSHVPGLSDPSDRRDIHLEDYDEVGGDGGDMAAPTGNTEDRVYDDEVEPLPLDEDLEDENGVPGTAVPPATGSSKGVQFKTPSAAGAPFTPSQAPNTGSTPGVVLDFGRTAQRGKRPDAQKKRAPRNRKAATRAAVFDEATMLSNEHIREQLKDTSDIVQPRGPGVVNRMNSLADNDDAYDENPDVDARGGGFNVGYYRDGWGVAKPPASDAEAFCVLRGNLGGRDPILGHQMTQQMARIRARCVETMWTRAGERWGAGYTGGATELGGRKRRGANAASSSKGGSSVAGTSFRGDHDDDDDAMPSPDHDDFAMPGSTGGGGSQFGFDAGRGTPGTVVEEDVGVSRQRARASGDDEDVASMDTGTMGSVPPTPANAPKGDIDWSVHTKRMLADIKPRLMKPDAPPLKVSEMTGLKKKKNAKGKSRESAEVEGETHTPPCKRGEAARIFYQVLVLNTHGFVEVEQADAYGDIDVTAGPKMKEKV